MPEEEMIYLKKHFGDSDMAVFSVFGVFLQNQVGRGPERQQIWY